MASNLRKILSVPTFLVFALASCASGEWFEDDYYEPSEGVYKVGNPYEVAGVWYYPNEDYSYVEEGVASWYGPDFHNGITANGETYDMYALTAAHRTLPLPSIVQVTNLENGRSLILRVNDRGPFVNNRIIDVSKAAAEELGFHSQGTTRVRVRILPEESMRLKEAMLTGQPYYMSAPLPQGNIPLNNVYANNETYNGSYEQTQKNLYPTDYQEAVLPKQTTSGIRSITRPPVQSVNNAKTSSELAIIEQEPLIDVKQTPKELREDSKKLSYNTAKKSSSSVPVKALPESGMYIQAGAFSSINNAKNLAEKLKKYGKTVVHPNKVNGKTVYRVRIGPFDEAKNALSTLDKMKVYGYKDARIVHEKIVKKTVTKTVEINREADIGSKFDREL